MHFVTRNVNTGFDTLIKMFSSREYGGDFDWRCHGDKAPIVRRESRNGPVLTIDEPVTITYTHPRERVLFNAARDANPFFHLYEALWMLAGRRDVEPVAHYCSRMKEFSDDGKTLNGAYGCRWRRAERYQWSNGVDAYRSEVVDQLNVLVQHLKAFPDSRRAVLQMWNVEDDLLKIGATYCDGPHQMDNCPHCVPSATSKDVCCNLSVMFSLRNTDPTGLTTSGTVLDMTVTNRSNDLVWGLLGTNYVHFTILQEYMAARLGVEAGRYHHFTNNLHVYAGRLDWKPGELIVHAHFDYHLANLSAPGVPEAERVALWGREVQTVPLVRDPEVFERELPLFVEEFGGEEFRTVTRNQYGVGVAKKLDHFTEPFLRTVAAPMLLAFRAHKEGEHAYASVCLANVKADDWRLAARGWIERRLERKGASVAGK